MNKDLIIAKSKELNKEYKIFVQWINKYTGDIIESQRGRNFMYKLEKLESELSALESSPEQNDESYLKELREKAKPHIKDIEEGINNMRGREQERELFEKIVIKSHSDLPDKGEYFCNRSGFNTVQTLDRNLTEKSFMREIRWYLKKVKH